MNTIKIKGKSYVMVNERIKYFKENYKNGSIKTKILSLEDGMCIFRAEVWIDEEIRATGHAYEKEDSTFINQTSFIENCETSAIGRALGVFGIGIDTSIASYEEVGNAVAQQEQKAMPMTKPMKDYIENNLDKTKTNLDDVLNKYKVKTLDDLTYKQAQEVMKVIDIKLEKLVVEGEENENKNSN